MKRNLFLFRFFRQFGNPVIVALWKAFRMKEGRKQKLYFRGRVVYDGDKNRREEI